MAIHDSPPVFDIFLSHSGRQKEFVKDLHERLSSLAYTVFFDQDIDSLPLGQNFPRRILSEAKTCKLGVVVLSEAFLTSKWPMIELNAFAARHRSATDSEFKILPLFLELLPEDLRDENKLNAWREKWWSFEQQDSKGRINVAQCEYAVTTVLPSLNGVIQRHRSEQREPSYINEVVDQIKGILPPYNLERFQYGGDPDISGEKYVGRERLLKVILHKFYDLDREVDHAGNNEFQQGSSFSMCSASSRVIAKVSIVGMYGMPGSGKTMVCKLLSSLFRGKVAYFQFPTGLSDETDDSHLKEEKSEFARLFSKIVPVHPSVPSMDSDKMDSYPPSGRIPSNSAQKMFLMLDNISASNSAACMTTLKAILALPLLKSGSRVMLVSRSERLLKGLLGELAKLYPHHTYGITEVPCLTLEEAKDIIQNRCPSVDEFQELLDAFLNKSSYLSSPLVSQEIGNYLVTHSGDRDHLERLSRTDCHELEFLWKGDGVKKRLDINFGKLDEHLKDLFFDITLFIIPAGYSKLHDQAIPILSRMHNMTDVDIEMQIEELEKQSWLSIIDDVKGAPQLRVHEIYLDFARSIPGNMARYINNPSTLARASDASAGQLSLIEDSQARKARDQVPDGPSPQNSNYPQPRTINIDIAPAEYGREMLTRILHVELGSSAKALIVRNRSPSQYNKCVLCLSGDLSTLVCLELQNVWQVAISPSDEEGAVDPTNLTRLALINDNAKEIQRITCTSQNGPMELIGNVVDFIPNQPWNPRSAWDQCSYTEGSETHNPLLRNLMAGATEMTGLRELILVNAGITKLDVIGYLCPQLEVLEVWNDLEHEKEMSVSIIGGAPKLKRLAAGPFPPKCSLEGENDHFIPLESLMQHRSYYNKHANARSRRSRKLTLELANCPELKEICVNGSFFDHVQMAGPFPAKVSDLVVANDTGNIDYTFIMPISSSLKPLSHLERLELSSIEVESLEFSEDQCGLPKLKDLVIHGCPRLRRLSLKPNGLPRLMRLKVQRCHQLDEIEPTSTGCRRLLRCLELIDLPKLPLDCPLLSSSNGISFTMGTVTLSKCPPIKINSGILEASVIIELRETGMIQLVHGQCSPTSSSSLESVPINQLKFENSRFQRLQTLFLENVKQLRAIEGIAHLPTLYEVTLLSLPELICVGGERWPTSIRDIWISNCAKLQRIPPVKETPLLISLRCNECNELKEVKLIGKVRNVEFMGCPRMEAFPLEDVKEELKKRR